MEKKVNESILAKIPAWALSLIVGIASIIIVFMFEYVTILGDRTIEITGFIFYVVLIPVACFTITIVHPKSKWYTPFICNPVAMLGTIFHPLVWTTLAEYLIWVGSLGLSVLAALVGAKIGRQRIKQAE